jgi:hypothetical protein
MPADELVGCHEAMSLIRRKGKKKKKSTSRWIHHDRITLGLVISLCSQQHGMMPLTYYMLEFYNADNRPTIWELI